jgi:hypothetical protein
MSEQTTSRVRDDRALTGRPVPDEVVLDEPVEGRGAIVAAAIVNGAAGLLTLLLPWLKDFGSGDSTWPPVVAGLAVLVAAAGRLARPELTRRLWTWVSVAAGVFLLVASVPLTESGVAGYVERIAALGLILIALLTVTVDRHES